LKELTKHHKVHLITFVKPYALSKLSNLPDFSSVLIGYQNTIEAQRLAAQMLLGKQEIKGKLPVSVNDSFPVGHGQTITFDDMPLAEATPFSVGMDAKNLLH